MVNYPDLTAEGEAAVMTPALPAGIKLPELEEEILPVFGGVEKVSSLSHGHVATPSQIK